MPNFYLSKKFKAKPQQTYLFIFRSTNIKKIFFKYSKKITHCIKQQNYIFNKRIYIVIIDKIATKIIVRKISFLHCKCKRVDSYNSILFIKKRIAKIH